MFFLPYLANFPVRAKRHLASGFLFALEREIVKDSQFDISSKWHDKSQIRGQKRLKKERYTFILNAHAKEKWIKL